jgi:hypothetical protein
MQLWPAFPPVYTDAYRGLIPLGATESCMPTPTRFDIVVFGSQSSHWVKALAAGAPIWNGLDRVGRVSHFGNRWGWLSRDWLLRRRRLLLPLRERNIAACPAGCWALVPSPRALQIFENKALFAAYIAEQGLDALAPRIYASVAAAQFPCVLKRVDLHSGRGIRVVETAAELEACLGDGVWRGQQVVLQALIAGNTEYVAHCVASNGRIVWQQSYSFALADPTQIRTARITNSNPVRCEISAADLADLERFLLPLGFDGPLNVDYKRGPDGRIVVLEINPRLGGSLFLTQNLDHLRDALRAIIANVKWRPGLAERHWWPLRRSVAAL